MATNNQYSDEAEYDCKHWGNDDEPTTTNVLYTRWQHIQKRANLAQARANKHNRNGNALLAKQYQERAYQLTTREDSASAKFSAAQNAIDAARRVSRFPANKPFPKMS
jgi:hypothetical protein